MNFQKTLFCIIYLICILFINTASATLITKKSPIPDNSLLNMEESLLVKQLSKDIDQELARNNNENALQIAKNASELHPQYQQVRILYVSLLDHLKQPKLALVELSKIKNDFSDSGTAFFMSSVLKWQENLKIFAIEDMEKATKLSPLQLKYWLMLSQMYHDNEGHGLDVHKKSLSTLLKAERYHKDSKDLIYRIAITYDEENKAKHALTYYEKLIALDNSNFTAKAGAAINSLKLSVNTDINTYFPKEITNIRDAAYLKFVKGVQSLYLGKDSEAISLLSDSQAQLNKEGHVDAYLAQAYFNANNNKQALKSAEAALLKGIFPAEKIELLDLIVKSQPIDLKIDINHISTEGIGSKIGVLELIDTEAGLIFKPNLKGLKTGSHGIHIHENGTCDAIVMGNKTIAGGMAEGHYQGMEHHHGANPAGDLDNIIFDEDQHAKNVIFAPQLTLGEVKGRSIMIHALEKNDATIRIACGMILEKN